MLNDYTAKTTDLKDKFKNIKDKSDKIKNALKMSRGRLILLLQMYVICIKKYRII
jgi:hypothetical protein